MLDLDPDEPRECCEDENSGPNCSSGELIEEEDGTLRCFYHIGYTCEVCEQPIDQPGDMSLHWIENIHTDCEPQDDEEEADLALTPMP